LQKNENTGYFSKKLAENFPAFVQCAKKNHSHRFFFVFELFIPRHCEKSRKNNEIKRKHSGERKLILSAGFFGFSSQRESEKPTVLNEKSHIIEGKSSKIVSSEKEKTKAQNHFSPIFIGITSSLSFFLRHNRENKNFFC